jgi:hypothetical protein
MSFVFIKTNRVNEQRGYEECSYFHFLSHNYMHNNERLNSLLYISTYVERLRTIDL